jgi:hypothetical protein
MLTRPALARTLSSLALALTTAALAHPATAATPDFQRSNILVTTRDFSLPTTWGLHEYTLEGERIQAIAIPYPTGFHPPTEKPRGVALTRTGEVVIYNGSFDPFLSLYDPDSELWTHRTHPDWNTANVGSHGNVAVSVDGTEAFASDMISPSSGIVAFDLESDASSRFGDPLEYRDVTLGLDGLLYALRTPVLNRVDVYDPTTRAWIRTIDLERNLFTQDVSGISVDTNGEIFAAAFHGVIARFAPDGVLLDQSEPLRLNLNDIDMAPDGTVVAVSRFGDVFVTDRSLDVLDSFTPGFDNLFVTIVKSSPIEDVDIDVLPGNPFDRLPLTRRRLPVAILGSEAFDVRQIDRATLAFGPAQAPALARAPRVFRDTDRDGFEDLVVTFETAATGLAPSDTEVCLTGDDRDGAEFEGCDAIAVTPTCGRGFELAFVLPLALGPWRWARHRRRPR